MVASKIERTQFMNEEGTPADESLYSLVLPRHEIDDDVDYQDELTQAAKQQRAQKLHEMQSQFPNSRAIERFTRRG